MNKFGVGDRVLINVPHPPNLASEKIPEGTVGRVTRCRGMHAVIYVVEYSDGAFDFWEDDLSFENAGPLLRPEMELDEIERAEQIMEGLIK